MPTIAELLKPASQQLIVNVRPKKGSSNLDITASRLAARGYNFKANAIKSQAIIACNNLDGYGELPKEEKAQVMNEHLVRIAAEHGVIVNFVT